MRLYGIVSLSVDDAFFFSIANYVKGGQMKRILCPKKIWILPEARSNMHGIVSFVGSQEMNSKGCFLNLLFHLSQSAAKLPYIALRHSVDCPTCSFSPFLHLKPLTG